MDQQEAPVDFEIEVEQLEKRRPGVSRILVGVLATCVLGLVLLRYLI